MKLTELLRHENVGDLPHLNFGKLTVHRDRFLFINWVSAKQSKHLRVSLVDKANSRPICYKRNTLLASWSMRCFPFVSVLKRVTQRVKNRTEKRLGAPINAKNESFGRSRAYFLGRKSPVGPLKCRIFQFGKLARWLLIAAGLKIALKVTFRQSGYQSEELVANAMIEGHP